MNSVRKMRKQMVSGVRWPPKSHTVNLQIQGATQTRLVLGVSLTLIGSLDSGAPLQTQPGRQSEDNSWRSWRQWRIFGGLSAREWLRWIWMPWNTLAGAILEGRRLLAPSRRKVRMPWWSNGGEGESTAVKVNAVVPSARQKTEPPRS